MNDTHRKPRLEIITRADGRNVYHDADKLDQAEAEARNPRDLETRYGRAGDLTGKVRDALNTQTTLPNSVASVESVVTPVHRVLDLTATEHNANEIDYVRVNGRGFVPASPDESGKSGDRAPIDEFAGGYAFAPRNDAVRAENQDASAREVFARVSDRIEASLERFGKACREAFATDVTERAHYAAVGMMTEEGEDGPTPEAQAEAFQAITAEPRPSAVAIKAALERGDEIIRKVLRWTPYNDELRYVPTPSECGAIGFDLRAMLGMLDRLGIHCLALEIERDGLSAQLDRITDQAKPIDGTDLAELVQASRRFVEGWQAQIEATDLPSPFIRGLRVTIDRLVAAVNDQGRRLREAETVQHPATAALLKESADLVELHWRGKMAFGPGATAELIACLSRTRWALLQAMRTGEEAATLLAEAQALIDESRPVVKWVEEIASMTEPDVEFGDLGAIVATARGTFQDPPRQVRYFSPEQERDAIRAIHARYDPSGRGDIATVPIKPADLVGMVAEALGLERVR